MNKKLVAVAVAGVFAAPAAALAQSSVTLSGQFKIGYEYLDSNASGYDARSKVTNNTSYVRLSGSEDLGNGLRGVFQIESEVAGDTTGGAFASRNTALGLAHKSLGTIQFGKWDMHYTSHAAIEGNGLGGYATALSANTLNLMHTVNGIGTMGGRIENQIRYASPTWAGFNFTGGYAFDSEDLTKTTPNSGASNTWNVQANWSGWGFNVMGSYLQRNNQNIGCANLSTGVQITTGGPTLGCAAGVNSAANNDGSLDLEGYRLGAAYTFGTNFKFKIGVIYDHSEWDNSSTLVVGTQTLTSQNAKRDTWTIPLSIGFGPHTIFGSYAWADDAKGNLDAVNFTGSGTGADMWQIGYDYAMSKRTSIGANYVQVNNDGNGRYDFWTRGAGTGGNPATAGSNISSFYLGVRHLF